VLFLHVAKAELNELANPEAAITQDAHYQLVPFGGSARFQLSNLFAAEDLNQALGELRELTALGRHLLSLLAEPTDEAIDGLHVGPDRLLAELAAPTALLPEMDREAIEHPVVELAGLRDSLIRRPWQEHALEREAVAEANRLRRSAGCRQAASWLDVERLGSVVYAAVMPALVWWTNHRYPRRQAATT
jgi:hypothetical protein